ncbi:hypothetical protein NC652_026008 [Populus alba x Populus x berolinensis]|nr:hypothetical protein NC652_026008 [Populus alba x Populus x berolinensis]
MLESSGQDRYPYPVAIVYNRTGLNYCCSNAFIMFWYSSCGNLNKLGSHLIQVFGFKNPFVQRLIRELVAIINEIAEQNPLSPSFHDGASRTEQNNRSPDASTHPDLLPYLPRSRVKGKRREIANKFFAVANIFIQCCLLAFIFC